jgi:hypothetical protein
MGNYLEAICVTESLILTGGKDRKICVLNKYNYQRLGEIDLTGGLPLSELQRNDKCKHWGCLSAH